MKKRIFLFSLLISLGFLSPLAAFAIDSTSSALRSPPAWKPNAAYVLTTGTYTLACGTDLPSNFNCSYRVTGGTCPSSGFTPQAIVSPINSGNVGSGKYTRGYRISIPTFSTYASTTPISCSTGCYALNFSEAKEDIDQDQDVSVTIIYTIYCVPT